MAETRKANPGNVSSDVPILDSLAVWVVDDTGAETEFTLDEDYEYLRARNVSTQRTVMVSRDQPCDLSLPAAIVAA